jgi:hypothetical protein
MTVLNKLQHVLHNQYTNDIKYTAGTQVGNNIELPSVTRTMLFTYDKMEENITYLEL